MTELKARYIEACLILWETRENVDIVKEMEELLNDYCCEHCARKAEDEDEPLPYEEQKDELVKKIMLFLG